MSITLVGVIDEQGRRFGAQIVLITDGHNL